VTRGFAARALLVRIAAEHAPAVLASSLSAEDMVLADLIAREALPIGVVVLDTGRLHGDTLSLVGEIEQRYGLALRVYRPERAAVEEYVRRFGSDAFYGDSELRKRCCEIRKVEPLRRALVGKRAWITGLRRGQSAGRAQIAIEAFDAEHRLAKFNPLAEWSESDLWDYVRRHDVPVNPLYAQGYRSIGCAPCTRPVTPVEDARAGRWWWEAAVSGECGIHIGSEGKVSRAKKAVTA